jgi:hypothetical protein
MLSPPLVFQSQQLRQFVPGVPKFVGFSPAAAWLAETATETTPF